MHDPTRMYYFLLVVSVLVYLGLRYVSRTAFGLALQGVRDDPVRMAALGYNVRLHRTLGFTLAAPVAGAAGVLSAWSNTRMSAGSISLAIAILVLTAAVIGGLNRLEGAWVGALLYTLLRHLPARLDRPVRHLARRRVPGDRAGLARRRRRRCSAARDVGPPAAARRPPEPACPGRRPPPSRSPRRVPI